MHKTEKYQLPQWERSDRILMEDFNQAMEDIESGIEGAKEEAKSGDAAIRAELGSIGKNLRVETGSYVGNGKYGNTNIITLDFQLTPVLVVVGQESGALASAMVLIRPMTVAVYGRETELDITWGEHSISYYSLFTAAAGCNVNGATYRWAVLGY